MKRTLLLILVVNLFLHTEIKGQGGGYLINPTMEWWVIHEYIDAPAVERVILGPKEVFDSTEYFALNFPFSTQQGRIREENGKVYYNPKNGPYANTEFLLYDFMAMSGDSMIVYSEGCGPIPILIKEIDTVEIKGFTRKRIKIKHGNEENYWITGIGSPLGLLNNIFFSACPNGLNEFSRLICVFKNGVKIYCYAPNVYKNCTTPTSIQDLSEKIDIFYDGKGIVNVQVNNPSQIIRSIRLIDLNGRNVELNDSRISPLRSMLDISRLPNGFYLVSVDLNNGRTFQRRIIKGI